MNQDTKDLLKQFEEELEAEALREEQEAGPAFDDPDTLETGPAPEVYSNFANDYGRELRSFAENGGEEAQPQGGIIVLMLIATILSLGIIGVMLYWLQAWM